ncbi:RteC domain-containing protein [Sphingobacterium detergens]|uniref:RteC protein n=1 Tax=Sphingobacterium detergens TaxID=1145106 RepID=A0A420B6I0_SPHD1|nr:RteC domain-containing protein [Sphingobacterium detergens]RKE52390.1 RteC protein [Sphingobacterium detergens]
MKQFLNNLRETTKVTLQAIALNADSELEKAYRKTEYFSGAMKSLNDFVRNHVFTCAEDEISFFKEHKPEINAELIYWNEITFFETNLPMGKKSQLNFYRKGLKRINLFFERNCELQRYYKQQRTIHDQFLFIRKTKFNPISEDPSVEIDDKVSTVSSYLIAKLIAYERLGNRLQEKIKSLKNGQQTSTLENLYPLVWEEKKVALVELMYALHYYGCFGTKEIKFLAKIFSKVFNTDLGDFYHTFMEISMRKINPTKFLDGLRECLLKKIQDKNS